MYHQQILELIKNCEEAERNGFSLKAIRLAILPELIKPLLESSANFLRWVKDDPHYSYFYFDVQERGVCAKSVEVAALIIETIVLFHLDEDEKD